MGAGIAAKSVDWITVERHIANTGQWSTYWLMHAFGLTYSEVQDIKANMTDAPKKRTA